MKIKNKSRPTPDLNIAQASKFTTRDYIWKFNDYICKIHDWICDCSENKRLYDFPCLLFDRKTNNVTLR